MKLEPGMKIKRKKYDFAVVDVLEVDSKYVKISDNNGTHYILNNDLEKYFSVYDENDDTIAATLPTNATLDNNLDDPDRHNINTANKPSLMQEVAYKIKDK